MSETVPPDGPSRPTAAATPAGRDADAAASDKFTSAGSGGEAETMVGSAAAAASGYARAGDGLIRGDDDMIISPQRSNSDGWSTANGSASSDAPSEGALAATARQSVQLPSAGATVVNDPSAQQAQAAGALFASQLQSQNPHAPMMFHPMYSQQYAVPQFQQMDPQQQALLFQQHLMAQQAAIQQQLIQQLQSQPQTANVALDAQAQQAIAQQAAAIQMQLIQQAIQQQLLQQSQVQAQSAAVAAQGHQELHPSSISNQAAAAAPIPQQPLGGQTQALGQAQAMNAPEAPQQASMHPLHNNLQLPQQMGIAPSDIAEIYRADESNYQAPARIDDSDDEDDDADPDRPSRSLLRLVEDHHWVAALQRVSTHPRDTQQVGIQGRTPLHVACDHDAPPALVQAILRAWPEGAERVGTSHMNPLHITCSSPHASVDVVRVLLAGCRDSLMITGAKDVDGDTPLHAACRCAAPMDVLVTLLRANPITVTWKDYEGLNPLMRLWVRYFVLVGEQIISNIKKPSDLNEDLVEAWQKSLLLLKVMNAMEQRGKGGGGGDGDGISEQQDQAPFNTVHAASSVDCPRCVVRIAMVLFPQELLRRDEEDRLPIHIAAAAPVYAVHDLRGEGFTIDDAYFDDDPEQRAQRPKKESQSKYKEPSVIDILLSGEPTAASERDPRGQLPLHVAIMRGKTLDEGVQALVEAHPDALTTPDNQTNLYPFMLAASVGRGRGDCTTIYALLRAAPELVHMAFTGELKDDMESKKAMMDLKPRAKEAVEKDGSELDVKPPAQDVKRDSNLDVKPKAV